MTGWRSGLERVLLTTRTVGQLRPAQLAHRARLRAQKAALQAAPDLAGRLLLASPPSTWGWPESFTPLDARTQGGAERAEAEARGSFEFLREARELGEPPDWDQTSAAQLWRYHLHYLEWGWDFASRPDRSWASSAFASVWRSWAEASPVGRWDAWSPYVASVRAWALCALFGALISGLPSERAVAESLALHAAFVRHHLEFDVGGNHLVKNLKALVGLGVFLGDKSLVHLGCQHLERQLRVQVLADGGHYERSPSYHAQVLGDFIDIAGLVEAARLDPVPGLWGAINRMRAWLSAMLVPDGDVPLFNDCTLVGRDRLAALGVVSEPHPPRLQVLGASGYAVVRPDERLHLVLDVGAPCPPELPAHAHADTLSFELTVDGRRIVVDSGTSTYQDASRRRFERSTAAHNTVEVDGADSTEVWGLFRAARRAHAVIESCVERADGSIEVCASHDGYRRFPSSLVYRRLLRAAPGCIELEDEVIGAGRHQVVSRFHAAPDVDVELVSDREARLGPLFLRASGPLSIEDAFVATGFGQRRPTKCVAIRVTDLLPVTIRTVLRLCDASVSPGDPPGSHDCLCDGDLQPQR